MYWYVCVYDGVHVLTAKNANKNRFVGKQISKTKFRWTIKFTSCGSLYGVLWYGVLWHKKMDRKQAKTINIISNICKRNEYC